MSRDAPIWVSSISRLFNYLAGDIKQVNFDPGYWALQCVAMMLTCLLIPKLRVDGPIAALLTVVVLAFINAHIWSSALFLKVPDSFAYKTLLLFVTNGILFWLVVKILPGIEVQGIFAALLAPVMFSIMSLLIDQYKDQIDWALVWKYTLEFIAKVKEYFSQVKASNSLILPNFSNFA
jgi:putative membrane protein